MLRRLFHLMVVSVVAIIVLSACAAPIFRPAAPAAAPAASSQSGSAAPAHSEIHALPPAAAAAEAATEAAAAAYAEAPAAAVEGAPAAGGSHAGGGGSYRPAAPVVTAGVVDDNEAWSDYLDYLARHDYVPANRRDVAERYIIQVVDGAGRAVDDARVKVYVDDRAVFEARSDAAGRVLFHPGALDDQGTLWNANQFRVVAEKGYAARSERFDRNGAGEWVVKIDDAPRSARTQLDLVFVLDATGSMGDEIQKLKSSMASVADQIARLPERPDVRYGLVAYRDLNDEFVVRTHPFTKNLNAFQSELASVYAEAGGDTPESVNEALHRTLNDLDWRENDTVRLVILIGDAPPHLDYSWQNFSYDTDMIDAVRKGIKIFPVGASNLDEQGEYIFRQLAQFTGGKFVFLTYKDAENPASGPGAETTHDVENYSVSTLDKLIVKLVREELAHLSEPAVQNQPADQEPTPVPPQSMLEVQPPAARDQVLFVLCVASADQLNLAVTQKTAGGDYAALVELASALPAALLRSAHDGDILCASTLDASWKMAEVSAMADYVQFIPAGPQFWVWDTSRGLMQGQVTPQ